MKNVAASCWFFFSALLVLAVAAAPQAAFAQAAVPSAEATAEPALRIALAPVTTSDDVTVPTTATRAALLSALHTAYGDAVVTDGNDSAARVAIVPSLSHEYGTLDVGISASDAKTGRQESEHFRFPDGATPAVAPASLVALIDRTLAPARTAATPPPVIALYPVGSSALLSDASVAVTALLAERLRDATGARVALISRADAANGAALAAVDPRMVVTSAIGRSGSAYDLVVSAAAADRTSLGNFHVILRDPSNMPPTSVFAPFLLTSLDAAPPVAVTSATPEVAVLPLGAAPEFAEAAEAARVALVDRIRASGTAAALVSNPGEARVAVSGTFAKTSTGYRLDLDAKTPDGGSVMTGADLAAPALMPSADAVAAFVTAARAAVPAARRHLIFVPFPNAASNDRFVAFANAKMAEALAQRGWGTVAKPQLEANKVRGTAAALCKGNDAQGILIGAQFAHDQETRKGALRSFEAFFSVFSANANAASANVPADDRSISRADVSASFIDCSGKERWTRSTQSAGAGAISIGIGQLVTSLFDTTALPAIAIPVAVQSQ